MSDLPAWLRVLAILIAITLWVIYCLFAINWKRMWPTLREGAWVPMVLLMTLVALVWCQVRPRAITYEGVILIGNFWWQLFLAGIVVGMALFCGWLQERWSLAPFEVSVEPPEHGHGDHHGHDDHHGHGHAPVDQPPDDPMRKHTASHDRGMDRGGEA